MTDTPISILQRAENLGLKLELKPPDRLTVESKKRWPRDFAETLRDYKPQLLTLLRLPFCMVYSEALRETIFLCEDEATKAALVEAGADVWSIYTRDELRVLIAHNRVNRFCPMNSASCTSSNGRFTAGLPHETRPKYASDLCCSLNMLWLRCMRRCFCYSAVLRFRAFQRAVSPRIG